MPADIIDELIIMGDAPKLQLTQHVLEPDTEDEDEYEDALHAAGMALADEWRARANLHKKRLDSQLEIKVTLPTHSSTFNIQTGETAYDPVDPEFTIVVIGDWLDAGS